MIRGFKTDKAGTIIEVKIKTTNPHGSSEFHEFEVGITKVAEQRSKYYINL